MMLIRSIRNAFTRYRRVKSIVILAYHRIGPLTGLFYDRNISATFDEFKSQMEYLKANFAPLSMSRVIDYYDGKIDIPRNPIVITFDDGFKDTAENAMPVLEEMGLPATLFVTTEFVTSPYLPWEDEMACLIHHIRDRSQFSNILSSIGISAATISQDDLIFSICRHFRNLSTQERCSMMDQFYAVSGLSRQNVLREAKTARKGMMNEEDLVAWVKAGLEIGSHMCSHPHLMKANAAQVKQELISSKRQLEGICKREIVFFAYPYGMKGYYDRRSVKLVQKAGYQCAVNMISGINTRETNRFNLHRMPVARNLDFRKLCDGVTDENYLGNS